VAHPGRKGFRQAQAQAHELRDGRQRQAEAQPAVHHQQAAARSAASACKQRIAKTSISSRNKTLQSCTKLLLSVVLQAHEI
jgi:hypothetical protein